jgi:hypothetical protein
VLLSKAQDISKQLNIDIETVVRDLQWGVRKLGHQEISDYLDESIFGVDETIAELGLAKAALKRAENTEQRELLQEKCDSWQQIFDNYAAEYRPSLKSRYLQLADLKDKEQVIYSVLTNEQNDKDRTIKYPDEMRLITVPYDDLSRYDMPAYSQNDTTSGRITDSFGRLASLYEGETYIDEELLDAERGLITPLDTQSLAALKGKTPKLRSGIDYAETPIGELARQSSQMANFGLMLVGKDLKSREELREMTKETGVDCMGAGLAEGLALCRFGNVRIGDIVGFPKYIPNSKGNYYAGLKVERINYPHANIPRFVFELWKSEGSQNCLLAVTPNRSGQT